MQTYVFFPTQPPLTIKSLMKCGLPVHNWSRRGRVFGTFRTSADGEARGTPRDNAAVTMRQRRPETVTTALSRSLDGVVVLTYQAFSHFVRTHCKSATSKFVKIVIGSHPVACPLPEAEPPRLEFGRLVALHEQDVQGALPHQLAHYIGIYRSLVLV